jgi:plastocyanin
LLDFPGMTRTLNTLVLIGAVAFAASCGSSNSTPPPTSPTPTGSATAVTVPSGARTLGSNAYSPNPVTITHGGTVTWTNMDTIAHTATSDTGVFNGSLPAGGQFSFTFPNAGTFTYHCTIHPGMVGTVNVQ